MRTSLPKTLILALAVLVSSSAFPATVWKWVDRNGVTHYSDQPVPGAVQVDLLNVQTYNADDATIPAADRPASTASKAAASAYRNIAISSPANEETFAGTGGQVSVAVQVDPGVQRGDSVRVTLDGQLVSEPDSASTNIELKEVPRGAHTLVASVVSRDGQVLIQSAPITFFMQQQSSQFKR